MLRSVFTVRHDRLAVALEGGHVIEVGDPNSGEEYKLLEILHDGQDKPGANGVDIAYSADASMVAMATEDKRVRVWRTGRVAEQTTRGDGMDEGAAELEPGTLLGEREIPKKPTSVLFAPTKTAGGSGSGGGSGGVEEGEVLVVSDKCGDAYAAPLPDPSTALKHLLGHTAMTITAMVSLKGGALLATADRAEHIRVSQFPRTTIIHTYLLGHKDFVSALAPVPGDGVLLLSGGGDGRVGLWDVETGQGLVMISVRQACQDLADGDASAAAATAETLAEDEEPSAGVADIDLEAGTEEGGGNGKGVNADAEEGGGVVGEVEAGVPVGDSKGGSSGGDGDGDGDGGEGGDGVPISVSCSEDGKTVAVVVSGLEGLLLLSLSRGGEGGEGASLTPRARLQLPTVPIQAGFLDGDLVVALPSSSSADCMQAFALTDGREGAVPSKSGKARAKCMCINAKSRARAGEGGSDGYTLKAAVPDEDATEALGGGLRKHKGTRNAGKSPSGWNNFSKRRDKKQDKKRKRGVAPRLALADDGVESPAPEADAATIAVDAIPNEVATPA